MGCWNATCCLSNLPISYGQEVYVWLIAPTGVDFSVGMAGNCHTNDMYYPISYAVEGKYNDYGGVEDIKPGLPVDYIEALFNNKMLTCADDNGKEQSTIDWLMESVERGKVTHYNDLRVDLFIARKDVVDGLYSIPNAIIAEHYQGIQEDITELCKSEVDYKDELDRVMAEVAMYSNRFLRLTTDINRSYLMKSDIKEMFVSFMKGRKLSDADMYSLLLTIRTQFILFSLRKCWFPQPSGVGSQAWDIREMKHFCGVVASICDKELKGH